LTELTKLTKLIHRDLLAPLALGDEKTLSELAGGGFYFA
jgi:hypothetical protein